MAWKTEPGGRHGGRQSDGQRERTAVEEEALLDHHIEEVLGSVRDAVRMRESDPDGDGQRVE